ncbi:phospholipase A and acyltransferase 4, partial [Marmota monax]|uniref:phospholipase A and acyltransferase 4 n=2 Tax=Marmota TaxID=9992 RepID=UPI001EAFABED
SLVHTGFGLGLNHTSAFQVSSLQTPKPGDLIEIFRFGYQHWVVYVGNGYVVHLTTPSKNPTGGSSSPFSVQGGKAMVKREQLEDVARGCSYQINNYLDDMYQPLSAEKIISYAEKLIGKEIWYNVLGWNCEHFVTHLRYGKSHSEQEQTPRNSENLKQPQKSCARSDCGDSSRDGPHHPPAPLIS